MSSKHTVSNLGEKIKNREEAIISVYGKNNASVKLSSSEVITDWVVDGFKTFKELEDEYGREECISIYDSGI